jgi:hypothetical protein
MHIPSASVSPAEQYKIILVVSETPFSLESRNNLINSCSKNGETGKYEYVSANHHGQRLALRDPDFEENSCLILEIPNDVREEVGQSIAREIVMGMGVFLQTVNFSLVIGWGSVGNVGNVFHPGH